MKAEQRRVGVRVKGYKAISFALYPLTIFDVESVVREFALLFLGQNAISVVSTASICEPRSREDQGVWDESHCLLEADREARH